MSDMKRVSELGRLLVAAQDKVKQKEAELKQAKEELNRLQLEDLPDLMAELGMKEFKLEDGSTISIKEEVDASITKANRQRAVQWLLDHGYEGLVKTEVIARFPRGAHDEAEQVAHSIEDDQAEVQLNENVHPQTLKAWVRERLQEGEAIPFDLFSVHPYNKAVVK